MTKYRTHYIADTDSLEALASLWARTCAGLQQAGLLPRLIYPTGRSKAAAMRIAYDPSGDFDGFLAKVRKDIGEKNFFEGFVNISYWSEPIAGSLGPSHPVVINFGFNRPPPQGLRNYFILDIRDQSSEVLDERMDVMRRSLQVETICFRLEPKSSREDRMSEVIGRWYSDSLPEVEVSKVLAEVNFLRVQR
jgi:hypothetical protein